MYDDLKDKRVVVTGGASGIGLATARRFVKESSQVVILDSNREALKKVLSEQPGFAGGVCADVSSPDEVEAAFKKSGAQKGDALLFHTGWGDNQRYLELGDNYPLRGPWFGDDACAKVVEICKANESNIFGYDTANCMDYMGRESWWGQSPRPKNWPSPEAKAYLEGMQFSGESGTLHILNSEIMLLGGVVNLSEIGKERVKLIALPMKLKGLGGGPTRVVAVEE